MLVRVLKPLLQALQVIMGKGLEEIEEVGAKGHRVKGFDGLPIFGKAMENLVGWVEFHL